MIASSVRNLSRKWVGVLSHYPRHGNDEHLDALFEEARRYTGLHLENDLCGSAYWSKALLDCRAAVVLFLVDRGVVRRISLHGRRLYEPIAHAEEWVSSQPSLLPYLVSLLELLLALRHEQIRRSRLSRS